MKRLLLITLILTFLMGCAQFERIPPFPSRNGDENRPESPLKIGMGSLQVVKAIGFPINGASMGDCAGVRLDVWVYNDGDLMLVFRDGQLSNIVGRGGERPSIRLYR